MQPTSRTIPSYLLLHEAGGIHSAMRGNGTLVLAPLSPETPENLQLSEEDRLLEVGCRWQALNRRGHPALLSTCGEGGRLLICPST